MVTLQSVPHVGLYAGYSFLFIIVASILAYCCAVPGQLLYLIYPGVKAVFKYFNVEISATTALNLVYLSQLLVWAAAMALLGFLVYASFYVVVDDILASLAIFFVGMIYFFTLCSYFSISKYEWMSNMYSEIYSLVVVLCILGFIISQLFSFSQNAVEYLGNAVLFVGVSLIPLIITTYVDSHKKKTPAIANTATAATNSTASVTNTTTATVTALSNSGSTTTVQNRHFYFTFRSKILGCMRSNSDEFIYNLVAKADTVGGNPAVKYAKNCVAALLKYVGLDDNINDIIWFLSWIPLFWFMTAWWYNPLVLERRGVALAVFLFVFMVEVLYITHKNGFSRELTLLFSLLRFTGALFGSHYWLFGIATIVSFSNFYIVERILDEKLNFEKVTIINMIGKFEGKVDNKSTTANTSSAAAPGALTQANTNQSCMDQYCTNLNCCLPCIKCWQDGKASLASNCFNFWFITVAEKLSSFFAAIIPAIKASKVVTAALINAIFFIVFIIGCCKVDGISSDTIFGKNQGSWACLILLTSIVLGCGRVAGRLIKYFGMASSILGVLTLDSSKAAVVSKSSNSNSMSTTTTTAGGAATSDITASAPTKRIKNSLIGLSFILMWLSFVCLSCLAAHLSGHWGLVPCITIIPLSLYSFYNFIVKWEKEGCLVPDAIVNALICVDTYVLDPISNYILDPIINRIINPSYDYLVWKCTSCGSSTNSSSVAPATGSSISNATVTTNANTTTTNTSSNSGSASGGTTTGGSRSISSPNDIEMNKTDLDPNATKVATASGASPTTVTLLKKSSSVQSQNSLKNLDQGMADGSTFYCIACFVSLIIQQTDTLWFSLLLLCGSVAFSALTIDFFAILYFGLWTMALQAAAINIVRWRSTLLVDTLLWSLVVISWIPTIAWSIVAGIRNRPEFGGYGVVVLTLFGSSLQLAIVSVFLLKDFKNVQGIHQSKQVANINSSSATDVNKVKKLKTTILWMYTLAISMFLISLIFFIVFVSKPLGVAFLLVFVGAILMTSSKLGVVDFKAGIDFTTETKTFIAVIAILACGILGAVSFPSKAFWWASLSWLFVSLLPLTVAAKVFFKKDSVRVYGPNFYPIFRKAHSMNASVEDVSFEGSCVHIFLFMTMLWGIFASVVLYPKDIGIVIYVISIFLAVFYSYFKSSNTDLLAKVEEFRGVEADILAACKAAKQAHSGEATIPLPNGQTAVLASSDSIRQELDLYLDSLSKDIQNSKDQLAALRIDAGSNVRWHLVFSSVPLINWICSLFYLSVVYKDNGVQIEEKVQQFAKHMEEVFNKMKNLQRFLAFADIIMYKSAKDAVDLFDADCIIFLRSTDDALRSITVEQLHALPHEALEMAFSKFKDYKERLRIIQEKEEIDRREQAEAELRRKKAQDELRLRLLLEQEKEEEERIARIKRGQDDEEQQKRAAAAEAERLEQQRIQQAEEQRRKQEEEEKRRKAAADEAARELARVKAETERLEQLSKQQADEQMRKWKEEESRRIQAQLEEETRRKAVAEEEARRKKEADDFAAKAATEADRLDRLKKAKEEEDRRREEEERIRRQRAAAEDEARRRADADKDERQRKLKEDVAAAKALMEAEVEARRKKAAEEEEARKKAAEIKMKREEEDIRKAAEERKKKDEEDARTKKPISPSSLTFVKDSPLQSRLIGRNGMPLNASYNSVVSQLNSQFNDPDFPCNNEQLGKRKADRADKEGYVFSRIGTIDKSVKSGIRDNGMPKQEVKPDDVVQGALGDCYFLSALACLAERPDLVESLFPGADASKSIFSVRLYFNGEIKTIVLDDFFVSQGDRAVFAHKQQSAKTSANSLWVMLLEKAYAKLYGDYTNIEGGFVNQALADLTGGVPDIINDLKIDKNSKWKQILTFCKKRYLLGAGSRAGSDTNTSDDGIVFGHAYAILDVVEVDQYKLLLLRNPWGRTEWQGKWSDNSPEWTPRYTALLNHTVADDGKFWIEWDDFVNVYRNVYVCKLFESSFPKCFVSGEWSTSGNPNTAGGCNSSSIKNNPQFVLKASSSSLTSAGDCDITVMLSICETETMLRDGYPAIGVYVANKKDKLNTSLYQSDVVEKSSFQYSRDVVIDFKLSLKSPVVIIPCTFNKDVAAKFTLTVYNTSSKDPITIKQL